MAWLLERKLENFYRSLQMSMEAGVPLRRALELATITPALRRPVAALLAAVDRSAPLDRAWREAGFFGTLDIALVAAGEQSGKLAPTFSSLAEHHRQKYEFMMRLILGLLYPLFLVLLAIVAVNAPLIFTAGPGMFLRRVLLSVAAVGLALLLAGWLWGMLMRSIPLWARFWYATPFVGGFYRARARTRFHEMLHLTQTAGLTVRQFGDLLAETADDAFFADETQQLRDMLKRDRPLSAALEARTIIPVEERHMLNGAEIAGKTAEMAEQLATRARAELEGAAKRLPLIIGGLVFLSIMGYIVYLVIKYVTDYYKVVDYLLR